MNPSISNSNSIVIELFFDKRLTTKQDIRQL